MYSNPDAYYLFEQDFNIAIRTNNSMMAKNLLQLYYDNLAELSAKTTYSFLIPKVYTRSNLR